MKVPARNFQDLKDLLLMCWCQITLNTFRGLVESTLDRSELFWKRKVDLHNNVIADWCVYIQVILTTVQYQGYQFVFRPQLNLTDPSIMYFPQCGFQLDITHHISFCCERQGIYQLKYLLFSSQWNRNLSILQICMAMRSWEGSCSFSLPSFYVRSIEMAIRGSST